MPFFAKYLNKYLSYKAIFLVDLIMSAIASVGVLLLINFFASSDYYSGPFALWWLGGTIVISSLMMYVFRTFNIIIRHMTIADIRKYIVTILLSDVLLGLLLAVCCTFNVTIAFALLVKSLLTAFLVLGMRFALIELYEILKARAVEAKSSKRILIYNTSEKSAAAAIRLKSSKRYDFMGFISHNDSDRNIQIAGYPVFVYQTEEDFVSIVNRHSISAILFVSEKDVREEASGIIKHCTKHNLNTLIQPPVDEFTGRQVLQKPIRPVQIEDLLARPEIKISLDRIRNYFEGKVVMVTGAAGSIGSELCRQLAKFGVKKLVLFDDAETPMHNFRLELDSHFPDLDFAPVVGSVRHENRLDYVFRTWKPQVVFHAAAYKHVPLMEENPCEAVFSNVYGTRLVADKCVQYGVEMMVMISTDKAVNPTNVMGCSKRLAEIYVQSLGLAISEGEVEGKTKFVTTRFGNVLGSNGSVIPRFREQISHGGPVTVTHPEITRYFMTIPEACRLVMEAATMSTGNQIFVFDMGDPVKIVDLAKRMIEQAGLKEGEDIQIEFTGLRPGEKLYEEVLADTESSDPTEHDKIRIARVREYSYKEAAQEIDELTRLSKAAQINDLVKLMKKIVPEFKSANSRFAEFDTQS